MAMPYGARRNDHSKSQVELDPRRSPLRNRESTPRPSISPLSTRASPASVRQTAMSNNPHDVDIGLGGTSAADAETVNDHDDRSSSLSDPEDDDEEDGRFVNTTAAGRSAEELSAHQSLEVDSEAETERLDHTPDKTRKHAENVGRTPSKLAQAATADDELSEPPSPLLVGPGAASSTSTNGTIGKKRKRSDTVDSSLTSADSDLGESPRKRSYSAAALHSVAEDGIVPDEPTAGTSESTGVPLNVENAGSDTGETLGVSEAKGGRGRKGGRPKGRMKKEVTKELETETTEATARPEEDQGEGTATKSAEELQDKQAASTVFEDVVKQFAVFRERIYNERLAAVYAELDQLNQPESRHHEYLRQVACIDARRQKQVGEAEAFARFKLESLRRTTLAERSQLHSQYFQYTRELREEVMYKLGEDWYNIQKERRQGNPDKDDAYIYKLPTKKSDQIKQQAKYNQEVSVLSGFAKYVGFPAAPDLTGAETEPLENDLKAMKISKRAYQQTAQPPPFSFPNRDDLTEGQRERLAHDQFIEQNAWARPQGPIINHGTPNLTHTPNWAADPATAVNNSKHLIQNLSAGPTHVGNPYATPMAQRRFPIDDGLLSNEPAELPSSVIAAPPTLDRMHHGPSGREEASPLVVNKKRQNGVELTGFRNVSNISGASTIDAPPDSAERNREAARDALVGIPKEASAPEHPPEIGQIYRSGGESRKDHEVYPNASWRPQTGAFGTPTPGAATIPTPGTAH